MHKTTKATKNLLFLMCAKYHKKEEHCYSFKLINILKNTIYSVSSKKENKYTNKLKYQSY